MIYKSSIKREQDQKSRGGEFWKLSFEASLKKTSAYYRLQHSRRSTPKPQCASNSALCTWIRSILHISLPERKIGRRDVLAGPFGRQLYNTRLLRPTTTWLMIKVVLVVVAYAREQHGTSGNGAAVALNRRPALLTGVLETSNVLFSVVCNGSVAKVRVFGWWLVELLVVNFIRV